VAESSVALPPVSVESHILHYTLVTSAIERLPSVPDRARTMLCVSCCDTMKHFRTIAKLGVRPKQFFFACPSCKGVDTKEAQPVA
jgi:hypothetical protein